MLVCSGGDIGEDIGEDKQLTMAVASEEEIAISKKFARDAYLACTFLLHDDRNRYGTLIEDLVTDFVQGQDHYPRTVTSAYNLLIQWKQKAQNLLRALSVLGNSGIGRGRRDYTCQHWGETR